MPLLSLIIDDYCVDRDGCYKDIIIPEHLPFLSLFIGDCLVDRDEFCLFVCFFCCFMSQSTATAMGGQSVHLTTIFLRQV